MDKRLMNNFTINPSKETNKRTPDACKERATGRRPYGLCHRAQMGSDEITLEMGVSA
jgi:hypothetical protein